ncbi:MAG: FAD:protein FMN transferase, partial [Lachnospiraceae bacterium]|nr:FAD:protein FMN transferase [Lachnospiraceae bacterium]
RSFEKDGITYHHLIDTKTGYPCNSDLASVSIISDSSFEADILSTVCYYLDYDKTIELQNKDIVGDFEAEFIYKDGSVKRTSGFERYEHKGED